MLLTTRSATIRGSTGSARASTSIASFAGLPRPVRSTVACGARATRITRQGRLAGLLGRGTRRYRCPDTAEPKIFQLEIIDLWILFVTWKSYIFSSVLFPVAVWTLWTKLVGLLRFQTMKCTMVNLLVIFVFIAIFLVLLIGLCFIILFYLSKWNPNSWKGGSTEA